VTSPRFPEFFRRFEKDVDISNVHDFLTLLAEIRSYAGRNWKDSPRQIEALKDEANKRGIIQARLRRFSSDYESFSFWMARGHRTSRYEQRIVSYMNLHPHATLREARGHRKR